VDLHHHDRESASLLAQRDIVLDVRSTEAARSISRPPRALQHTGQGDALALAFIEARGHRWDFALSIRRRSRPPPPARRRRHTQAMRTAGHGQCGPCDALWRCPQRLRRPVTAVVSPAAWRFTDGDLRRALDHRRPARPPSRA
jgi:hypothetical protein